MAQTTIKPSFGPVSLIMTPIPPSIDRFETHIDPKYNKSS